MSRSRTGTAWITLVGGVSIGLSSTLGCGEAPAPSANSSSRPSTTSKSPNPKPVAKTPAKPAAKPAAKVDPRAYADPPQALAALVTGIRNNDISVVANAEAWFGLQGEAAAKHLAGIVKNPESDLELRLIACRALARVNPHGGTELLECLSLEPDQLKLRVIESLSRVKPSSSAIVGKLRELANEGDVQSRRFALMGLARIGPPARAVAPDLQRILNDTSADEQLRGEAGKALKAVDPRKGLMGVAK
ncbi:MAG: hypothetical protein RLY70_3289 [Planctomycetota bacterium]|jgi:HEAT repeats